MATPLGFSSKLQCFRAPPGGALTQTMPLHDPSQEDVHVDGSGKVLLRKLIYTGDTVGVEAFGWQRRDYALDTGNLVQTWPVDDVANFAVAVNVSQIPDSLLSDSERYYYKEYIAELYTVYAVRVPFCYQIRPDRGEADKQVSVDVYYTTRQGETDFYLDSIKDNWSWQLLKQLQWCDPVKTLAVVQIMIDLGKPFVMDDQIWDQLTTMQKDEYTLMCKTLCKLLKHYPSEVACVQSLMKLVYSHLKSTCIYTYNNRVPPGVSGVVLAACVSLCNTNWYMLYKCRVQVEVSQLKQMLSEALVSQIVSYM
jgi:hypothetical protein